MAYKKLCLKQNENDRRALLRKEAEEAMKQNGIERPRREKYKKNDPRKKLADDKYRREREEYVRRRAEYEEQLDEKVCVPDRGFINHDNNLEMFELSAKFDMLRRNMKTFILPGIAICIGDTIASISDCFVCRRNGKCNYSHRDGLCKDCFHAKHDNKLCVDCKKNKRKFKGGLCKRCSRKQGNEIVTKKCVGCNTKQAKRKGGLCQGCYKKQDRSDSIKEFCVVCIKNGKEITADCEGGLCKECFSEQSLKELGKEYHCVTCLQNGKTVSARRKGRLCRSCYWNQKAFVHCKVCNSGGAGSDGMCLTCRTSLGVYCARNKKLCVDCNQNKRKCKCKGDFAEVATGNQEMKL